MAQYTSEEALNGILNIISSVVNDFYENRINQNKQSSNNETADLISELLGGATVSSEKTQSVGEQVEALARGMKMFKEAGITKADGQNVASIISTIGSSLNNIDLNSYNGDSVLSIANALSTLGKIDSRIVDSINYFTNIEPSALKNITELINTLSIDIDKIHTFDQFKSVLNPDLGKTLSSFTESFNVNSADISNINKVIAALSSFDTLDDSVIDKINSISKIDTKIIDSINKFAKLNPDALINMSNLIDALSDNLDKLWSIDAFSYAFNPELGRTITEFAKSFDIKKSDINNINKLVMLLSAFKAINNDVIDSINNLENIDVKVADSIAGFIDKFSKSVARSVNEETVNASISSIIKTFSSINDIIEKQQLSIKTLFMPAKGRLIGRAIGNFINAIAESIPNEEITIQIDGLSNLIYIMSKFTDPNSPLSFRQLKKIMSYENGKEIGLFFKGILDKIPLMYNEDGSIASPVIASVTSLISILSKFTAKDFRKIKKMLSYKNGIEIGAFFKALTDEIPESKSNMDSVVKMVRALSSLGATSAVGLMMLKPVLNEKFGKSINAFVTNLLKGMNTDRVKQIDIFTASMKPLGQGILLLTSSIILIGASIALLGAHNIIASMGLVTLFTAAMLSIVKKVSSSDKDIKSGASSLNDIAKVITLLTGDVVLLTVAANLMDFVNWDSIGKIAVAFTMIASVMTLSIWMSKDYKANGEAMKNTMQGMSTILLSASISIGIMTYIAKNNELADMALGVTVIGLVVGGTMLAVNKILEKSNKDYSNAVDNLTKMTAILGAVSLISMFILPKIGENFGPALAGGAVVSAVMLIMGKIVTSLSKLDNKKLDEANKTLAILMTSFAAISLLSAYILPKIGENFGNVALGEIVVMSVISTMGLMVYGLSKKIRRRNLREANSTLLTLTTMFASISLITALVLPKIANNIDTVTIGSTVVLSVIATMGLMVYGLSKKIRRRDLHEANSTLLTLTTMFASISLVAAFILPKIGDNVGNVAVGLAVVSAVVFGLSSIVLFMTKFIPRRNLKEAHKTLAVLTTMLAAVSIIAAVLFPAIAQSSKEVIAGSVIVLGIISVMTAIVWGLSLIKNSDLRSGTLTLAAIGVMLVATSAIITHLIIPIGEQWEPAKNGSIVVAALIAGMGAIVALTGKVLKKNEVIKGAVAIGLSAVLLAGVSYIIKELIIPIGADAEKATEGSKVVIATIGALGIIVAATGKIKGMSIVKGIATIGGVTALLWAIGKMLPSYIKTALMMEKDAKRITDGGLEIAGTIGVWGIIMGAIGALISGPQAAILALGAGAVTGISAVLWAIGKMLPSYTKTALMINRNKQNIKSGSAAIKEIIMSWGLIIGAVGALIFGPQAIVLALGAGAVTGIAAVMRGLNGVIPKYVSMANIATKNRSVMKSGSEAIKMMLSEMTKLISAIGKMTLSPATSIAMLKGKMTIGSIGSVISKLSNVIEPLARIIKKINAYNITPEEVGKLERLFKPSGRTSNGNNIFDAVKNICDSLNNIGLISSSKARIILKNIQPIFNTISTFVDVVGKLSSMKYVTEWNADGTPKAYETLSMSKFRDAAVTVSVTFRVFMVELSKGMDSLKSISLGTIAKLAVGIKPIVMAVNTFTNTVLSALNSKIETEWDKNGNPTKFRKFTPVEFKQAATVIASGFANFIITFGEAIAPFSKKAGDIFNSLKNGIKPVVDSIVEFTNTIYGIMDGKEFTFMENGQEVRKMIKFDPQKFLKTSDAVSKGFTGFVETLYNSLSKYEIDVTEYEAYTETRNIAWGLKKTETTKFKEKTVKKNKVGILLSNLADIGLLVNAVGDLTNLVLETIEKKNFNKVASTANIMSTSFTDFISIICGKLGNDSVEKTLENTTKNLDKIKKLISSFKSPYNEMTSIFSDKNFAALSIDNTEKLFSVIEYTISKDNLARIKDIDPKEIESVIPYTSSLIKIAANLNDLTKAMKNADMTNACTQFIKDIEVLTQPQLADRANASRRALNMFGTDLTKFTKVVVHSEKKFVTFTSKMNKAESALKKFDKTLVDNERKRNKALEDFAKMVDGMAASIEKLSEKIETLDKNKIIENFQGIKELLELTNSVSGSAAQTPQSQQMPNASNAIPAASYYGLKNAPTQNQATAGSSQVFYPQIPQKRKTQRITMQFANTHFDGFITTEDT